MEIIFWNIVLCLLIATFGGAIVTDDVSFVYMLFLHVIEEVDVFLFMNILWK